MVTWEDQDGQKRFFWNEIDEDKHGEKCTQIPPQPCFYVNHYLFILISFGKALQPTTLVEVVTIDEEHDGEELVKDFASFRIDNDSPSPEM